MSIDEYLLIKHSVDFVLYLVNSIKNGIEKMTEVSKNFVNKNIHSNKIQLQLFCLRRLHTRFTQIINIQLFINLVSFMNCHNSYKLDTL